MFTGIIQAVGSVAALQPSNGDLRLRIRTGTLPLADVALGDSIATGGCCLTVVELPGDGFWADVSRETIAFTTIANWRQGDPVNLEKSLTPNTAMGGHIVSGHVDGIGEVIERHDDARSIRFTLRAPANLAKYIAHKGSICVDGVSLTVNALSVNAGGGTDFELNIIPHTAQMTTFGTYRAGSQVNLEVDVVARYLERLLQGERAAQTGGVTAEFLAKHGFGSQ
jgi:riboflavin synthase